MRRLIALLLPAVFLATAAPALGLRGQDAAAAQVDRDTLRQGLLYEGLQRTALHDVCRGAYRLILASARGIPSCTHGPDPAPPGVDVTAEREPPPPTAAAVPGGSGPVTAAATQVPCFGTGSDGYRVQLVYARAADKPDAYASWLPSFQQWAARIDDVFNASAAETGGVAHVRFVHDASCVPVVNNVVLSTTGDDNVDRTITELRSKGYNRSDRKYLVWTDAGVYCAVAEVWPDDSAGPTNANNGPTNVPGLIGRIDKSCWGNNNLAEVHELTHTLGGVQPGAPNGTPGFHCKDEYDRVCYSDGTAVARVVCASGSHEALLDCNHDDYFSTNPPANSYLATHWNVARSRFLSTTGAPPPPPTTTPPTTTPPTTPPTTAATTTTAPPPSTTTSSTLTTTTTATTATTAPPAGGTVASAPHSLFATQPAYPGTGVLLAWRPPASVGSPPFTAYRIYRASSPGVLMPLVDLPSRPATYNDRTTTPGVVYWYYVKAVNTAGESPPSNLTRMIAR